MGFTLEQKKAITTENANILVSAAAGSGKTAVLVERIINIITDSQKQIDIDNLLIVTFTSAAAAEMKERITKALENIAENSNNEHILRQLTLINHADINTIHSFCMKIVRENYTKLDIDPDFRVADENECAIIKSSVLEDIFENEYSYEDNKKFTDLVEIFGEKVDDNGLKNIILKIHNFIQSMPFPEKFLIEAAEKYNFDCIFDNTIWGKYIIQSCKNNIEEYINYTDKALNIALKYGPESYAKALSSDMTQLLNLKNSLFKGLGEFFKLISDFDFVNIGRAKKDDDKVKAEIIKELRNNVKNGIDYLKSNFFFSDIETEKDDIKKTGYIIKALVDIVNNFCLNYANVKKERNIVDFNDLEHFALKILVEEKEGGFCPSIEALQIQKKYYEVMTDEYQDSNPVQELVLFSVSGRGKNENNRFMVGDVKQSIYRFRQAEPNIFIDKYNSYKDLGDSVKINLFKNFRSREEIIYGINFIFKQIMTKKTAEVDYSEDVWLYPGMDYEPNDNCDIELNIIEKNSDKDDDTPDIETEMEFVAKRIKELFYSGFNVYDTNKKEFRALKYSDISIIMRKAKNWGSIAVEVFERNGIPAYSEISDKYFERSEIADVLSILNVIDNSRQDIPLIASLKMPYFGITDDELLKIRMFKDSDFYSAAKEYSKFGENNILKDKLNLFFDLIKKWKLSAPYISVGELIWDIYNTTGHYDYVGALNNGAVRQANLTLLVDKAYELEKNNFKGLFNFIRYIDRLQKTGSDFGGKPSVDSDLDYVNITTIHKSKGLEYPVVFLCGTGSNFNREDTKQPVVMHKDMGIACDYTDVDKRVIKTTLSKKVINDKIKTESVAEEMRVLYVALTRAREKLIITGSVANVEKKCHLWTLFCDNDSDTLPNNAVLSVSSFLDWICMCLSRHKDGYVIREMADLYIEMKHDKSKWKINIIQKYDIKQNENEFYKYVDVNNEYKNYDILDFEKVFLSDIKTEKTPANLYVSEVNRILDKRNNEEQNSVYSNIRFLRPRFLCDDKNITAAQRGTIIHKVIESIDFRRDYDTNEIKKFIVYMVNRGIISKAEAKHIDINIIYTFLKSNLIKRAKNAEKIYKEVPFALEMTPYELFETDDYLDFKDTSIVHGMIDCFFIENKKAIIIDYKTNNIKQGEENILKEKYYLQLKIYKKALERALKIPVNETYIFALSTGKAILL